MTSTTAPITRERNGASSHTPGPWACERHDEGDGSISYEIWNNTQEHYGRITTCNDDYDHPNSMHNARLIAAAPEMLAALTDLLEIFEGQDFPALDKARAALRKAEGRDA